MDYSPAFKRFFEKVEIRLKEQYETVTATGKTISSISHRVYKDGGVLEGGYWLPNVDLGRGPASGAGGSSGGGSMVDAIQKWAQAKGLDAPKGGYKQLARRLTYLINKYGTRRYKTGSDLGILANFDKLIEKEIDDLANDLSGHVAYTIRNSFAVRLKGNKNIQIKTRNVKLNL